MSSTFDQHCGQCGHLLPPGSTSCPNCGAPVTTSQPAATPASSQPSEYFPGMAEQVDSSETLVRIRPEDAWEPPASAESGPFAPLPGSGTLPASGGTGPTGPQPVPPTSGYVTPPPAGTPWGSPPQSASGALAPGQQPLGAPPVAQGWAPTPTGPIGPVSGQFPYLGQQFPGAPAPEMYGAQPQAPYGTMPGMYPPGYVPPVVAPAQPRVLPRWFLFGAAALIIVGLLLVWLTGSDWANSGLRVGIGALVVAVLILIVFAIGRTQGFRSTRIVSIALVSVLILIVLGAAGITLQGPVHSLQGGALEGQQKFQAAVSEFNDAGNTLGVARTYNDWGDSLLASKTYALPDDPTQTAADGALQKYQLVLADKNITQSSDPDVIDQVARAKNGVVKTVLAWGNAHLSSSDYQGAVDRFKIVLDQKDTYVTTPSFADLHLAAAKAYYGLGQQQIANNDCTDAVQSYQTVQKDYSDTPQGAQATSDLKKPQNVTGTVIDFNTQQPVANVKLFLSSKWSVTSGFFQASNDNIAISAADGTFKFSNLTPGSTKYLISYINIDGRETIVVSAASGQPANVVVVQPLCGADAGPVIYNLPAA